MEPDKRRFVRKRTDQLLYAEFGPDNGSILLNLSEDGCSFQSMAPVRDEQLRFYVSVGDGRKLEGDGQMVWSDTEKKMGGLRFLNPSPELREQVREWLDETLVTADGKLDPNARDSKAKRRRKKLRDDARIEAGACNEDASSADEGKQDRETGIQTAEAASVEGPFNLGLKDGPAENMSLRTPNDETPATTWRGVGAIALAAVLLVMLIAYRRELGHVVMSFGSSIAGDEQKAGTGGAAEPRAAPENVNSSGASNGTPSGGSEASSSEKPAAMSSGETTNENGAESQPPASNEQSKRAAEGSSGTAKRSMAQVEAAVDDVPALWTSVENGDTHAEVTLAARYVHGNGVPQSCAQARVLLEAAVKRGSAEARQRLDELGQAGCP